jgi:hypothetical protein
MKQGGEWLSYWSLVITLAFRETYHCHCGYAITRN